MDCAKLIAALLMLLASSRLAIAAEPREGREISMAQSAIFWSLVTSASPVGRLDCSRTPAACSEDRAELGLALLAGKTTSQGISTLVELLRYRMDAGLAEGYTCHILAKKKVVATYLSNLQSASIRKTCKKEVEDAASQNPTFLKDVEVDSICAKEDEINIKRNQLLAALTKGKQCNSSNF
jgi:hypothetical protein